MKNHCGDEYLPSNKRVIGEWGIIAFIIIGVIFLVTY